MGKRGDAPQPKNLESSPVKIQLPTTANLKDAEKTLVGRCLAGEERAWEELCQFCGGTIGKIASSGKWRFDPHELEDVTQDIMLEIVTSLKNFEFKSDLRTFVYSIAVHTCIGLLEKKLTRKRIHQSGLVHIDPFESGTGVNCGHICVDRSKNPEELLVEKETLQRVMRAVMSMDGYCKQLIMQRYFAEVTARDLALRYKVKSNTLVVQLKRSLVRLHAML